MSYLRDYQLQAKQAIFNELSNGATSTLAVMPTGCGKTQVALDIADTWPQGEVLFLAHRQELIYQPHERWHQKTGQYAEIIMADLNASTTHGRNPLLIASVATLCRPGRLCRAFPDPHRVGLIICDEAHHCVKNNKSYSRIIDYFTGRDTRLLGITATPDRADEIGLGEMFQSVAFEYPLFHHSEPSAIGDGYLVPIQQEYVVVNDLDLSCVRTRAGDFIDSSLEQEMLNEKVLHRLTAPTMEIAGNRKVLMFNAGIIQAIKVAEIFNRAKPNNAIAIASRIPEGMRFDFVTDSNDREQRRKELKRFRNGEFQYLSNMGIFLEGYDEPTIEIIAHGRPTKSRALYSQISGRGLRPLPGIIERPDGTRLETPDARKAAIASSKKPNLHVLDYVGNSRLPLVHAADLLGNHLSDEVVERAKRNLKNRPGDVREALHIAECQLKQELIERRRIQAKASFQRREVTDPFSALDAIPQREPGWHRGRMPSERMKQCLSKFKVEPAWISQSSFWSAKQLIGQLIKRAQQGLCSYSQAKLLKRFGELTDVSFEQASERIEKIKANGWKPLPDAGVPREPGCDDL